MGTPKLTRKQLQALAILERTPKGLQAKSLGLKLGYKPDMRMQVGSLVANKLVAFGFADQVKGRYVITEEGREYLRGHPHPGPQDKTPRKGKQGSRTRGEISQKELELARELIRLIRNIKQLLDKI